MNTLELINVLIAIFSFLAPLLAFGVSICLSGLLSPSPVALGCLVFVSIFAFSAELVLTRHVDPSEDRVDLEARASSGCLSRPDNLDNARHTLLGRRQTSNLSHSSSSSRTKFTTTNTTIMPDVHQCYEALIPGSMPRNALRSKHAPTSTHPTIETTGFYMENLAEPKTTQTYMSSRYIEDLFSDFTFFAVEDLQPAIITTQSATADNMPSEDFIDSIMDASLEQPIVSGSATTINEQTSATFAPAKSSPITSIEDLIAAFHSLSLSETEKPAADDQTTSTPSTTHRTQCHYLDANIMTIDQLIAAFTCFTIMDVEVPSRSDPLSDNDAFAGDPISPVASLSIQESSTLSPAPSEAECKAKCKPPTPTPLITPCTHHRTLARPQLSAAPRVQKRVDPHRDGLRKYVLCRQAFLAQQKSEGSISTVS